MKDQNLTIGITGGIGAGKSVVSRILRCNGFKVYDCDYEAKQLMIYDTKVKEDLINSLGKDIYFQDGTLNRGKLSSYIFTDSKKRIIVNNIVHTAVRKDFLNVRGKIIGDFFIESAILSSSGLSKYCDQIWIIKAPLEDRIRRVIIRDKTDAELVEQRIEVQKKNSKT